MKKNISPLFIHFLVHLLRLVYKMRSHTPHKPRVKWLHASLLFRFIWPLNVRGKRVHRENYKLNVALQYMMLLHVIEKFITKEFPPKLLRKLLQGTNV